MASLAVTVLLAITAVLVAARTTAGQASNQFDCDSPLRTLLPELFTHCSACHYGPWSEWRRISKPSSSSNCPSGFAYQATRSQTDQNGQASCDVKTETKYFCEPTLSEKADVFIQSLNLHTPTSEGKPPIDISVIQSLIPPIPVNITQPHNRKKKSLCSNGCSHTAIHTNRRRSTESYETHDAAEEQMKALDDSIVPTPFSLDEHLSGLEQHRRKKREVKDNYMVFILDVSGSIGQSEFDKMIKQLQRLVPIVLSCNTKIAILSYSTNVYREYCFCCDQSVTSVYSAVGRIPYSAKFTATGDAIHSTCSYVLLPGGNCGYPTSATDVDAPTVDVVLFTDGKSNRGKNPCTAANCWSHVKSSSTQVLSVGVNNYEVNELECIKGSQGSTIDIRNMDDLKAVIDSIIAKLKAKQSACFEL